MKNAQLGKCGQIEEISLYLFARNRLSNERDKRECFLPILEITKETVEKNKI